MDAAKGVNFSDMETSKSQVLYETLLRVHAAVLFERRQRALQPYAQLEQSCCEIVLTCIVEARPLFPIYLAQSPSETALNLVQAQHNCFHYGWGRMA